MLRYARQNYPLFIAKELSSHSIYANSQSKNIGIKISLIQITINFIMFCHILKKLHLMSCFYPLSKEF